jgi:hypothetical protein
MSVTIVFAYMRTGLRAHWPVGMTKRFALWVLPTASFPFW